MAAVASVHSLLESFNAQMCVHEHFHTERSLLVAAGIGDVSEMVSCLNQGCDPNVKIQISEYCHPVTALCIAASRGHHDAVRVLLAAGARAEERVGPNFTALYLAALGGHEGCANLLLGNFQDRCGRELLMELAAEDGSTPLMIASHMGRLEVVDLLLRIGARTTVITGDGAVLSAFEISRANGHEQCAALIQAYDINCHVSEVMC